MPLIHALEAVHYDLEGGDTPLDMSMGHLLARLVRLPVLSNLTIVQMDWMKETSGVGHEFLVLEYCLPSVPDWYTPKREPSAEYAYLRLDRAAGKRPERSNDLGDAVKSLLWASVGVLPVQDSASTD